MTDAPMGLDYAMLKADAVGHTRYSNNLALVCQPKSPKTAFVPISTDDNVILGHFVNTYDAVSRDAAGVAVFVIVPVMRNVSAFRRCNSFNYHGFDSVVNVACS